MTCSGTGASDTVRVGDQPKTALGHWCSAGARIPGRWPTQSHPRPLASCRCHDIISVADPKPPSAIGVLLVPGFQVGGRPKSALGHWCFASATISSRWPTQIRPRPLVFCQCHRYHLGGRPKTALGHWCFASAIDIISVADPNPPSATGVLPVPSISSRWPTQIRPQPLVFCRCHDIISVADPNPPLAAGVLPVPRYHLGGRPKSTLGHWCSAGATISGWWPTQIRPRPLVFCQFHHASSVADPIPPLALSLLPVPGHWCPADA
ncbi:uncharacterized protein ISCGN_018820 [Ixodes scapularis]